MSKIPYEERRYTYNAALAKWGMVPQLYVAIEEMSEVI